MDYGKKKKSFSNLQLPSLLFATPSPADGSRLHVGWTYAMVDAPNRPMRITTLDLETLGGETRPWYSLQNDCVSVMVDCFVGACSCVGSADVHGQLLADSLYLVRLLGWTICLLLECRRVSTDLCPPFSAHGGFALPSRSPARPLSHCKYDTILFRFTNVSTSLLKIRNTFIVTRNQFGNVG